MSHYSVAVSPAVPRPAPHPALSDVRAALRDSLKEAAQLRKSASMALAAGRQAFTLRDRVESWPAFYKVHHDDTVALAQSAATRRALHLLYGMLRGHSYVWLEGKTSDNNMTHPAKVRYLAHTAIAKFTGKTAPTDTFNLPSEKSIGKWMYGEWWGAKMSG